MRIVVKALTLTVIIFAAQVFSDEDSFVYPKDIQDDLARTCVQLARGPEAPLHSFPAQVAIYSNGPNGTISCAASLISRTKLLTAAHCLNPGETVKIFLGYDDLNEPNHNSIILYSNNFTIHQEFAQFDNDIGIITLDKKAPLNVNIYPVILDGGNSTHVGEIATIRGWGHADFYGDKHILHYMNSQIIDEEDCKTAFSGIRNDRYICLLVDKRVGDCLGDSGSPLTIRTRENVQIGISSIIFKSCLSDHPAGYVRVNQYRHWIAKHCPDCIFSGTEKKVIAPFVFILIMLYLLIFVNICE